MKKKNIIVCIEQKKSFDEMNVVTVKASFVKIEKSREVYGSLQKIR